MEEKRNNTKETKIRTKVEDAIKDLIKNEKDLFKYKVREETFSARLAMLLKEKFEDLEPNLELDIKVDCEYNKKWEDTKQIICFDNPEKIIKKMKKDLGEFYDSNKEFLDNFVEERKDHDCPELVLEEELKKQFTGEKIIEVILECLFTGIRPDIIIHKRGIQDENILAIEIKKNLNPNSNSKKKSEEFNHDRDKLKSLTATASKDDGYKYKYGLFLILEIEKPYNATLEWYKDGKLDEEGYLLLNAIKQRPVTSETEGAGCRTLL